MPDYGVLDGVYRAVAHGILVQDGSGLIVHANPAAEDILGLTVQAMRGHEPQSLWRIADEKGNALAADQSPGARALRKRGAVRAVSLCLIRADGMLRWVQVDAVPVLDEAGEPALVVSSLIDISERRQLEEVLTHQALHDALTGLPNRTLFYDRLGQALRSGRRDDKRIALLVMDLNGFKEVNDTFGHQWGDLLLLEVGHRLRQVVRASDTVARLGGDEFAALLPATDLPGARVAAERMLREFEQAFVIDEHHLIVGMSIGIALYPEQGDDEEALLRQADVAMYAAKRRRTGYAVYHPDQDHEQSGRLLRKDDLRRAIGEEQLVLHYQPKLELKHGGLTGVEALVRWQHPRRGLVSPADFMPLAEQSGLILPLTRWVVGTALRQCSEWRATGLDVPVSVNLSMRDLHDADLVTMVGELLDRWSLPASCVSLEITETAVMANPGRARSVLAQLRQMGVSVAIDDFGTGYSSLGQLKRLPVDVLKVDQSFIASMRTDAQDAAIVGGAVDLGHNLGMRVVAEGVEDRPTHDLLVALGCDGAQGFYLCPPLPEPDVSRWLRSSGVGAHGLSRLVG